MQRTIRASAAVVVSASTACRASCSIATWSLLPGRGRGEARRLRGDPRAGLLDVHPVQPQEVLAEDLALGLLGQLRVPVAVAQILRDLEVPEGPQGPLGMPDRRLRAVAHEVDVGE